MLHANEASELAKSVLPAPIKVSKACDKALDAAVVEAIESGRNKVDIALGYSKCNEPDAQVKAYLVQQGYKDVEVSHDYPGYNESYEGATFIKFTF